MPEKFGQKILWTVINSVFTLVIGYILLSATVRGDKWLNTEKVIDSKADVEYVDKQDAQIQKNLDDYKHDQEITRTREYDALNEKIDLVVELLKEK